MAHSFTVWSIRFATPTDSNREFKISCGCSSQEQNCRNDWSTCLGLFIETALTDVKKNFWLCFCFNGSPISISVSSYIADGWISILFANDPCTDWWPVRSIPWTTLARIIWSRFGPVVKGEIRLSISNGRFRPRQYSINFSRFSNDFEQVHFECYINWRTLVQFWITPPKRTISVGALLGRPTLSNQCTQ